VIAQDVVTIVVGQAHAWFPRDRIALADLTTTAWIMRESGLSGAENFYESQARLSH
jgi:hypothetical protein